MRIKQRYPKEVKEQALLLRRQGKTYREILSVLHTWNIPKNTLSNWCTRAHISLTAAQQGRILDYQRTCIYKNQLKGAEWNRRQCILRKQQAKVEAETFLKHHPPSEITDLYFLSGLYLGEGSKRDHAVVFGNSNPRIIQTFLHILRTYFQLDEKKLAIRVFIRFDQDEEKIKHFWSKITNVSITQFQKIQKDKRTKNSATYASYKGVCAIHYGDAKIQRFLLEFQQQYMQHVLNWSKMGG